MFSFLKFLNPKSDTDKNNISDSLSGKTLNLNSAEARVLNIFNTKSPIARKSNGNEYSLKNNTKETVTSPGFSFRIAQRARETKSTTPNMDTSNLSISYTLENSLNGNNTINSNNTTSRDIYDKKRKLMETLDNFGVRKRTRQECGVDAFVNRRRKTINESSNTSDRVTVINGHNHRATQPIIMNSKNVNVENRKIKRHGDFGSNITHVQKKPRTRNNEILSSYSSSKFLLTPGQKRPHSNDNEGDSPDRKHCKSCTCCGSTVLLDTDKNNLNKKDKTTETDPSDNFVTVAASRIFNRSGKTQVIKKMCMKTVLDEVFEDVDHVPYTSIEKVEEKKKKVEQYSEKSNMKYGNQSDDSVTSVSSTIISKCNEIQPAVNSILSTVSPAVGNTVDKIDAVPVTSTALLSTPVVQSTNSPKLCIHSSDNELKLNKENENNTSVSFNFGNPISSVIIPSETNKQTSEVDGKETNQTPEFTNNKLKSLSTTVHSDNEQHKLLFQNAENNKNSINDKSQIEQKNKCSSDNDKLSLHFTESISKPNDPIISTTIGDSSNLPTIQFGAPKVENKQSTPAMQFSAPKLDNKQSTPILQFGASKLDDNKLPPVQFGTPILDDKQSKTVMQFGGPKLDAKQTTPIMQFGAPKTNDKQSTPIMQFGDVTKVIEKQSIPVMQFGSPKLDDKKSSPVMQFNAPKADNNQSTSIIQFGVTKVDDKESTPMLQFGATKETEKTISTPLFSFGNNQKPSDTTKSTGSVKFQFGSAKSDNPSIAVSSIESKNAVFGANNLQNQNLFNFGKTDNIPLSTGNPPKYDNSIEKTNTKLQFNALSTPVFGTETSNVEQSKSQFITSVDQSNNNQNSKLVFGSQITENKPTSIPGNMFNNAGNSMFQFNNSSLKPNNKSSESSGVSFPFTSTAPTFGMSATQDFGNKSAFQFNAPKKTDESETQFSSTVFGSQNTTTHAPFKFGGNDKPASFGSAFPSTNQPIQFTNNNEKSIEPFKFGSTVPSNNTFQFSANKADNNTVKFGQTSNTFSVPGFNGFGNSTPQQTTTFGNVSSTQPTPFGNMTSSNAAPTFGNTTSPPSNTFGTNQGFQFGNTNNAPSSSSTFAFTGNSQPTKSDGAFNFNAVSTTASPFQFGQTPSTLSTPQFGGTQPQGAFGFGAPLMTATVMPGTSQPLFSVGTAPANERRKAKAVRRRQ